MYPIAFQPFLYLHLSLTGENTRQLNYRYLRITCNGVVYGKFEWAWFKSQDSQGATMPICCRCNGSGRCKACSCVKSGRPCVDCLPSRNGHCSNHEIHTSVADPSMLLPSPL